MPLGILTYWAARRFLSNFVFLAIYFTHLFSYFFLKVSVLVNEIKGTSMKDCFIVVWWASCKKCKYWTLLQTPTLIFFQQRYCSDFCTKLQSIKLHYTESERKKRNISRVSLRQISKASTKQCIPSSSVRYFF